MQATIIDIHLKSFDEEINISPFSDIHFDSPECDIKKFHKIAKRRSALQNSVFVAPGDVFNSVLPCDIKRYQPTCLRPGSYTADNLLDHMVDQAVDEIGGYPWVMFCQGNHEHSIVKNHYVDLTRNLARRVKCPTFTKVVGGDGNAVDGGYSGFIRLRFWDRSRLKNKSNGPRASIDMAYHHGAWGGQGGGIIGARRWATTMQGARVYLFGHNHRTIVDPFEVMRVNQTGRIVSESAYVVMCGTYLNTFGDGKTTYSEKGGFAPVSTGTPLITLRLSQERENGRQNGARVAVSITVGD